MPVQNFRLCRSAHGQTKRICYGRRLRRAAKPLCSLKGENNTMDYQKLYSNLFNGITDTIEHLKQLQIQAEEDYLTMAEERKGVKLKIVKSKTDTHASEIDAEK